MYLLAILTSTFVKCLFDPFALLIESSIDEEYDEKKEYDEIFVYSGWESIVRILSIFVPASVPLTFIKVHF